MQDPWGSRKGLIETAGPMDCKGHEGIEQNDAICRGIF